MDKFLTTDFLLQKYKSLLGDITKKAAACNIDCLKGLHSGQKLILTHFVQDLDNLKELPVFVQFENDREEICTFRSMHSFITYCVAADILEAMDFTMVIQGTELDLKELEDILQDAKNDFDNAGTDDYEGHEVEVI